MLNRAKRVTPYLHSSLAVWGHHDSRRPEFIGSVADHLPDAPVIQIPPRHVNDEIDSLLAQNSGEASFHESLGVTLVLKAALLLGGFASPIQRCDRPVSREVVGICSTIITS